MSLKLVIVFTYVVSISALSLPTSQYDVVQDPIEFNENATNTAIIKEEIPGWHVSVRIRNVHYCNGAIIHNNWVVTSAQCIFNCDSMKSMVTVQSMTPKTNNSTNIHKVIKYIMHEGFKLNECNLPINDIGLLQIENSFFFYGPVPAKIIKISSPVTVPSDTKMDVSGWEYGVINNKAAEMGKVDQWMTIGNQQCLAYYYSLNVMLTSQFCAVYTQQTVENPCSFVDLGSPMVLDGRLVGIKSWKMNCTLFPHSPTMFTNVRVYYDWIRAKVGNAVSL
ncbi:trypsin-like [Cotesia glomerata]|uniref:Peptidase S1 domain-containing protein n=1 Tax=Cotesia glomerata TaxID=32391 RepID=A0AAV7HQA2_COTGL|nr:trypsin-like [Cotesia glomerata]KAH0534240.1 hypothetical protein KQX54_001751 [Cotesia glomerata]